jgi:hypothetical protein
MSLRDSLQLTHANIYCIKKRANVRQGDKFRSLQINVTNYSWTSCLQLRLPSVNFYEAIKSFKLWLKKKVLGKP